MRPAIYLLADGPGDPEATRASVREHSPPGTTLLEGEPAADGDVVIVAPGCVVGPGWLDGLERAAASDTIAATASPVLAAEPLPAPAEPSGTPARVAAPSPACAYVRRSALQAAGPLDGGFARRCLEIGLQHLLTGDVVAGWPQPAAEPADRLGAEDRVRRAARRRSRRLSVTVDARCLDDRLTGTQVHALELIAALRRLDALDLRVIVPERPGEHALATLDGLARVGYEDVRHGAGRTDVVHRPYQVTASEDIGVLSGSGERVVLTHQDLIAYRNPAYHASPEAWAAHRRHTREALALADLVVFESGHAAADALADDLVDEPRLRVVGIGVDANALGAPRPERPAGAPDGPFLLCLGADYRHKQRTFAMRLVAALRERHGWEGALVLAGPVAGHGSAAADERAWREANPGVPVADLGPVSEAAKRWLYERADAVAYPTTYEGFGLVPFEAAAHGTPCLWAPVSSLESVLDPGLARLVPWDVAASAERAIATIRDPGPHVEAVRAAGRERTWDRAAAELAAVYEQAAGLPARTAAVVAADALTSELARSEWEGRYWALRNDIGPTGLALVGPEDPLLAPAETQVLAGLLRRPATRRLTLAALRGLARLR